MGIFCLTTLQFHCTFHPLEPPPESDTEDEWPPFRKTGVFDPYSDDPRLAVKRVVLCPLSGTLVVAGTAGHVVIAKFDTEVLDGELKVTTMNIVNDRDGFVWKGHDQLTARSGEFLTVDSCQTIMVWRLTATKLERLISIKL